MTHENVKLFASENFYQNIEKGLVLVDFSADWCGPCRMLAPILDKVAEKMKATVVVGKLDIDEAQKIASSFQVTSVPTMILFDNGKEVGRFVGLCDEKRLETFITSKGKTR